jgi:hypothetical protein
VMIFATTDKAAYNRAVEISIGRLSRADAPVAQIAVDHRSPTGKSVDVFRAPAEYIAGNSRQDQVDRLHSRLVEATEDEEKESNGLVTAFTQSWGHGSGYHGDTLIVAGRFMFNTTPNDVLSHKFDRFSQTVVHSNWRKTDCLVFDSSTLLAKEHEEETLIHYLQLMLQSMSTRGHVHVAIVPVRGD